MKNLLAPPPPTVWFHWKMLTSHHIHFTDDNFHKCLKTTKLLPSCTLLLMEKFENFQHYPLPGMAPAFPFWFSEGIFFSGFSSCPYAFPYWFSEGPFFPGSSNSFRVKLTSVLEINSKRHTKTKCTKFHEWPHMSNHVLLVSQSTGELFVTLNP